MPLMNSLGALRTMQGNITPIGGNGFLSQLAFSTSVFANYAKCVIDSVGNTYAAGKVGSNGAPSEKALLVKIDTTGTIVWQKTLGASTRDFNFQDIAIDSSDNIYVVGKNYSTNIAWALIKYTSAGVISFNKVYDNPNNLDWTGAIMVNGTNIWTLINDNGTSGVGSIISKLDLSGNNVSTVYHVKTTPAIQFTNISNIVGSNYAIAGIDQTGTYTQVPVVVLNTSNVVQWTKLISLNLLDISSVNIKLDSTGNVYVLVRDNTHSYLIKINNDTTIAWSKKLGSLYNDFTIYNDMLYLVGTSKIIAVTAAGNLQYIRAMYWLTAGNVRNSVTFSSVKINNGKLYVVGNSNGTNCVFDTLPLNGQVPYNGTYTLNSTTFTYVVSSESIYNIYMTYTTPTIAFTTLSYRYSNNLTVQNQATGLGTFIHTNIGI